MKRLDFYKTYTGETERTAELLPIMHNQTCFHEIDAIHDILTENDYKINDFQFVWD